MFSLSPIPPTPPARIAATPVKGDDWCGTPMPVTPPLVRTLEHVNAGYLAMLDAHSALNPMAPMVYEPGVRPIAPDFMRAIASAKQGIAAIDRALDSYGRIRDELATALESAADEARRGHAALTVDGGTVPKFGIPGVSRSFDAAAHWLVVAGNLLHLRIGTPGVEPFTTA